MNFFLIMRFVRSGNVYIPQDTTIVDNSLLLYTCYASEFYRFKEISQQTFKSINGTTIFSAPSEMPHDLQQYVLEKNPYSIQNIDRVISFENNAQKQFHLQNIGENYGLAGEDINVTTLWREGVEGNNVHVTIIGSGCFRTHFDVVHKYNQKGSKSLIEGCYDGKTKSECSYSEPPNISLDKDTQLAGLILGSYNSECGRGIAPLTTFSCINYSSKINNIKKLDEISKINNDFTTIKLNTLIRKCRYNSSDSYPLCPQEATFPQVLENLEIRFINSRNGKGLIYILPSGDNGNIGGDAAFTFMQQSRISIIVSSTTNRGTKAYYSNRGCSVFINAPSGGFHWKLDKNFQIPFLGSAKGHYSGCERKLYGTSSSSAIVSGVISLILSKKPDLTWRDIQYILALTAVRNDPKCTSWKKNSAGIWYSHFYGFGRINSGRAYELAMNWKQLPPELSSTVNLAKTYFIDECSRNSKNIFIDFDSQQIHCIESVIIHFTLSEDVYGPLHIILESPSGTTAELKTISSHFHESLSMERRFVVRNFFGEDPNGRWRLSMKMTGCQPKTNISKISLSVFGAENSSFVVETQTSIDPFSKNNWPDSDKISIESIPEKIHPLKKFSIKLNYSPHIGNKSCLILLIDRETNRQYCLMSSFIQNEISNISIPNIFSDSMKLEIAIEVPSENVLVSAPINVVRSTNIIKITKPKQFQKIISSNTDDILMNIKWQLSYDRMPPSEHESMAYISLYDYELKINKIEKYIENTGNYSLLLTKGFNCRKCLLMISPVFNTLGDKCRTLVQPFQILKEDDFDVPPFDYEYDNSCSLYSAPRVINEDDGRLLFFGSFAFVVSLSVILRLSSICGHYCLK